jgi:hypothetical protein
MKARRSTAPITRKAITYPVRQPSGAFPARVSAAVNWEFMLVDVLKEFDLAK